MEKFNDYRNLSAEQLIKLSFEFNGDAWTLARAIEEKADKLTDNITTGKISINAYKLYLISTALKNLCHMLDNIDIL